LWMELWVFWKWWKEGRGPEGKELRSKPSFLSTCALRADALLDSPIGRISLIGTDDSRLFFLTLEHLCSEFMFPFVFSQNSASSRVYCHPERPEPATYQCRNTSLYGTLALMFAGRGIRSLVIELFNVFDFIVCPISRPSEGFSALSILCPDSSTPRACLL
jgi:hypothetical protein